MRAELQEWQRFVLGESHVLRAAPAALFQQAANQPASTAPARSARRRFQDGCETRPWLRLLNKPDVVSACLMTLSGHERGIAACAFSMNDEKIVSSSKDETVRLWNAINGFEQTSLRHPQTKRHWSNDQLCALSPDGARVLSAWTNGWIKIWDIDSSTEVGSARVKGKILACGFSSKGPRVVTMGRWPDLRLLLWDATTGKKIRTLRLHLRRAVVCCFAPDGTTIVSGSRDAWLRLWDSDTGRSLGLLGQHRPSPGFKLFGEYASHATFSSDGATLLTTGTSAWDKAKLWDVRSHVNTRSFKPPTDAVDACAISTATKRIAFAQSASVSVTDLEGKEVTRFAAHSNSVHCCNFSSDGRRLVTGSQDQTLRVWDTTLDASEEEGPPHLGPVCACAITQDGTRVATSSRNAESPIVLWEGLTQKKVATLKGVNYWAERCAFWPDGRRLVAALMDKTLMVWDTATNDDQKPAATLAGHTGYVVDCSISPDGGRFVSASEDQTLILWDGDSYQKIQTLTGHKKEVRKCGFSPDGAVIASCAEEDVVKLWEGTSGKPLFNLRHESTVRDFAFAPDGTWLVSGDFNFGVIWDTRSGRELSRFPALAGGTTWCVSPDGARIASSFLDGFSIFDAHNGQEVISIRGQTKSVEFAAFSPDAGLLVTISQSDTVKVWNPSTGEILYQYLVPATSVAWSPDSTRLIVGSAFGSVEFLHLEGLKPGPPIITVWRGDHGVLAVGCPFCKSWSEVQQTTLGNETDCTECGKPLKLNSFVIAADWRPVAKVWGSGGFYSGN